MYLHARRRSSLALLSSSITSPTWYPSPPPPISWRTLFFSTLGSSLADLPKMVETTFLSHKSLSSRLLSDHDAFSKQGGITADRVVLSPKNDNTPYVPLSAVLPISHQSPGVANFVGILDQLLLASHDVISHVAPGSPVLIVTEWTASEFAASLPKDVAALIRERQLHVCTIHAKEIAGELAQGNIHVQKAVENVVVLNALKLVQDWEGGGYKELVNSRKVRFTRALRTPHAHLINYSTPCNYQPSRLRLRHSGLFQLTRISRVALVDCCALSSCSLGSRGRARELRLLQPHARNLRPPRTPTVSPLR